MITVIKVIQQDVFLALLEALIGHARQDPADQHIDTLFSANATGIGQAG
jgi:hypothetical protein